MERVEPGDVLVSLSKKKSDGLVSSIGKALDVYEVRIEGYFSEVFPAADEDGAIAEMRRDLPVTFTVDDAVAWKVDTTMPRPRHGKHQEDSDET